MKPLSLRELVLVPTVFACLLAWPIHWSSSWGLGECFVLVSLVALAQGCLIQAWLVHRVNKP